MTTPDSYTPLNVGAGGDPLYDEQVAASTTVAAGSNGAVLPQATINVLSTAGQPSAGMISISGTTGQIAYAGLTATTYTGCTGGTGTLATGQTVTNLVKIAAHKMLGGPPGLNLGPIAVSLLQKLVVAGIVRIGGDSFVAGLGLGEDAGWFPTAGTLANGGTAAVTNATLALVTTSNAASSSLVSSLPVAALQSGMAYSFRAGIAAPTTPTTFQVTAYKGGVGTSVASTAFSQQPGFTLDGNYHGWTIEYVGSSAVVLCDNVPVHVFSGSGLSSPRCNTFDLPQSFQLLNGGGNCTARWGMFTLSGTAPQDGFAIEAVYSAGVNTLSIRSPSVTRYGSAQPADPQTSGSITATNQSVVLSCAGLATVAAQVTGTWSGTLEFDASLDGSTWVPIWTYDATGAVGAGAHSSGTTTTVNGLFTIPCAGAKQVRVTSSTFTWTSGTAAVSMRGSTRARHMAVTSPQFPAALGAHGGLVVEGNASGTPVPVTDTVLAATVVAPAAFPTTKSAVVTEDALVRTLEGALRAERNLLWFQLDPTYAIDAEQVFLGNTGGGTAAALDATTRMVKHVLSATTSADASYWIGNKPAPWTEGAAVLFDGSLAITSLATSNAKVELGAGVGCSTSTITNDALGFYWTSPTAAGIFVRSSTGYGTTTVASSAWNVDKLDGTGPSGITADWTKLHAFRAELFWSANVVAYFVSTSSGYILVHVQGNATATPLLVSPNLRAYCYLWNTATASGASTIYSGAAAMHTVGGDQQVNTCMVLPGTTVSVNASGGAKLPLLTHRMNTSFGSVVCNRIAYPTLFGITVATAGIYVEVWIGSVADISLTGASFANPSNAPESASQIDTTATAVTLGANARLLYRQSLGVNTTLTYVAGANGLSQLGLFGQLARRVAQRGDGASNLVCFAAISVASAGSATTVAYGWQEIG